MKRNQFTVIIIAVFIVAAVVIVCFNFIPKVFKNPYLDQAEKLYNSGDLYNTIIVLGNGLEKKPDDDNMNYLLLKTVNIYSLLEFAESEKITDNSFINGILEHNKSSKNEKIIAEIGYYLLLRNNKELAKTFFEKAISINDHYSPAYNYLGNYYFSLLDITKARECYDKLFNLNPECLNFYNVKISDETIEKILRLKKQKVLILSNANNNLLASLSKLKRLEILSMSNQGLTNKDFQYIVEAKSLKVLSICGNQLTSTEGLDNLVKLRLLNINNNHLNKINNLSRLINIERLDLSGNQIEKIENLNNLRFMQFLDLRNNKISKLENLSKLRYLQHLNLKYNQISKMENLDSLMNVQEILLSNNQIEKIENLDNLKNIMFLDLFDNHIKKIEGINNLRTIQQLDVSKNQISRIEDLDSLHLIKLFLSFNKISKIENLNLVTLKVLSLDNNPINQIENLDLLYSLQNLNLSNCNIHKIKNLDNLKEIKILLLNNNSISVIENLDNLKSLQTLNLALNQISKVENLDSLVNLKFLDLTGNQTGKIDKLEKLTSLQQLYLGNIQLDDNEKILEIPPTLVNLRQFVIDGSKSKNPGNFQHIKGLNSCSDLENFEADNQKITDIPDMSSLTKLTNLRFENCHSLKTIEYDKMPTSLRSLILWDVNLKNLNGVEHLSNLVKLWIGGNKELTNLSKLNSINSLRNLNIGFCKSLPVEEIFKLNNLMGLYVTKDQYSDETIKKLEAKGISVAMR